MLNSDTKDSALVVIKHLDKEGKVMAYIAPDGKMFAGRLRLPGGKLKENESYQDTVKRELLEEYGISINDIHLLLAKPNILGGKVYLCSAITTGEASRQEDDGEPEWHDPKNLISTNMVPNCKLAVFTYLSEHGVEKLAPEVLVLKGDSEFMDMIQSEVPEIYNDIFNS